MAGTFTNLHYHLVFPTKDRLPLVHSDFQSRLYGYIGGILGTEKCTLLAAGGMPDHIHLLVLGHPSLSISDCLRILKSRSSLWINDTIRPASKFAWQEGYGAFTVSPIPGTSPGAEDRRPCRGSHPLWRRIGHKYRTENEQHCIPSPLGSSGGLELSNGVAFPPSIPKYAQFLPKSFLARCRYMV